MGSLLYQKWSQRKNTILNLRAPALQEVTHKASANASSHGASPSGENAMIVS